jgi:hypothetical protein
MEYWLKVQRNALYPVGISKVVERWTRVIARCSDCVEDQVWMLCDYLIKSFNKSVVVFFFYFVHSTAYQFAVYQYQFPGSRTWFSAYVVEEASLGYCDIHWSTKWLRAVSLWFYTYDAGYHFKNLAVCIIWYVRSKIKFMLQKNTQDLLRTFETTRNGQQGTINTISAYEDFRPTRFEKKAWESVRHLATV